ncbi:hypothetical protein GCM10009676_19790 [Prauserella halophila]|uniref:Uncharacterized protein n=1 Tax=Prauserella halophila TaxID=185641 RepID=A0ABN1WAH1_9PSEU|nr:hypothetical protein [Prauserella halophila]MCP2235822.1 hypothetical protein [Prauserella halophila]
MSIDHVHSRVYGTDVAPVVFSHVSTQIPTAAPVTRAAADCARVVSFSSAPAAFGGELLR